MATAYSVKRDGYKKIYFFQNDQVGLRGYVVIHDARIEKNIGGIRMFPYSSNKKALADALKLAEAMAFKLALANMPRGGAKAVIIGNSLNDKTKSLLKNFGQFIESLKGQVYLGEDIGINAEDLRIISSETKYCSNQKKSIAMNTARGVLGGIKACLKKIFGDESLKNKKIAIQGIGKVGRSLAGLIHKNGGNLILTDTNKILAKGAAKEFNAQLVEPDEIYSVACDVFSPCAIGNTLNKYTIKRLNCKIIAGSANNQLAENGDGYNLFKREILYAPDFIINAGGVMTYFGKSENWIEKSIYNRLIKVMEAAKIEAKPLNIVADKLAKKIIQANLNRNF